MDSLHLKKSIFSSLNGILAIIFGLVTILFPTITLVALAIYFAVSILVGGLVLTISSLQIKNQYPGWQFVLLEGILGILIGIIIVLKPEFSAAVLVTIIGLWAILLGCILLISWYRIIFPGSEKSVLLVSGIFSLIFGILITFNPFEGSRAITLLIGVYMLSYGIFSIISNNKKR